jgi:hypothetical protein
MLRKLAHSWRTRHPLRLARMRTRGVACAAESAIVPSAPANSWAMMAFPLDEEQKPAVVDDESQTACPLLVTNEAKTDAEKKIFAGILESPTI